MREELEAAKTYLERNQSNYWDDSWRLEREAGERYLGRIGRTDWLLSYAPLGVAGEYRGRGVEGVNGTLGLTDQDLADIAVGLRRLMAAYDKMGIFQLQYELFHRSLSDQFLPLPPALSPRTSSTGPWEHRISGRCGSCSTKRCAWPIRKRCRFSLEAGL